MCDQCEKYKAEIDALEIRVEELEEQIPEVVNEFEGIPWSDLD